LNPWGQKAFSARQPNTIRRDPPTLSSEKGHSNFRKQSGGCLWANNWKSSIPTVSHVPDRPGNLKKLFKLLFTSLPGRAIFFTANYASDQLRPGVPGRPGRFGPGLPQIRTCPIQASGSSSWRFAMMHPAHHRQSRYPWSLRGPGCGTLSSHQVSRPRVPNSASPSLHRVPVTRVPRLQRYYERLRLPCTHPTALRFLRLVVPAVTPVFAPPHPTSATRPGALELAAPRQLSAGGTRTSQVPGEPSCAFALLSDPGRTIPSSHCEVLVWPLPVTRQRLPRERHLSRLNHTASALAVYASPRRLLGQDARLASGRWLSVTGRDWIPSEFVKEVSENVNFIFIPFLQALPGASPKMSHNHNVPPSK